MDIPKLTKLCQELAELYKDEESASETILIPNKEDLSKTVTIKIIKGTKLPEIKEPAKFDEGIKFV